MHLIMFLLALVLAFGLRLVELESSPSWSRRWNRTLRQFLFSPLLLLMTAIAIVCMGPQGQMVRWWEGWGSYILAVGFVSVAIGLGVKRWIEAGRSLQQIHHCPQTQLHGHTARLIASPTPYIAQIGLWQPELIISQGLLQLLDGQHLEVVFVHEQGHYQYRDTFWFFWLGWLRRLTSWLPQTEALWQELLVLRELRADRWAAQRVDPLLLAEALLSVVSASQVEPDWCAALSSAMVRNRLDERITALLEETEVPLQFEWRSWIWLFLVLVPLFAIPFHH